MANADHSIKNRRVSWTDDNKENLEDEFSEGKVVDSNPRIKNYYKI